MRPRGTGRARLLPASRGLHQRQEDIRADGAGQARPADGEGPQGRDRGPSEILWGAPGAPNAWVEDFIQDPRLGLYAFDDFSPCGSGPGAATAFTGSFGQWTLYQGSNSGTIVDAGIIGGGIQFVPSSGTVSSGASTPTLALQSLAGAFQLITNSSGTSALQGKLAFQFLVPLTSITN